MFGLRTSGASYLNIESKTHDVLLVRYVRYGSVRRLRAWHVKVVFSDLWTKKNSFCLGFLFSVAMPIHQVVIETVESDGCYSNSR